MTTVLRFSRPSATLRVLPYAGAAAVTALVLAACGGGGGSTTGGGAPAQGSTPAPTVTGGNGGGQGQRQPGVTGLIADVNGSTMQVQTRTDQTAVSWSGSTTFTKTVAATLADVTVGSCVTAIDMSSAGVSGSATTAPTSVTASNVQVRPATNGECTGGFGGFGGGPGGGGSGAPTAPPTRTGTATPGQGRQGGGFGGRAVQGTVTAVSGSTITVEETMRARGQGTATGSATAGTQQSVTVTTTGSTTFAAEKPAAASDVLVGECATALGKPDDTGSVAATSISLRPATNGSCTGGGNGGRGASATTSTQGA